MYRFIFFIVFFVFCFVCCVLFFFFKQKTAYEIYQCDWSSDVCSSDLDEPGNQYQGDKGKHPAHTLKRPKDSTVIADMSNKHERIEDPCLADRKMRGDQVTPGLGYKNPQGC